jgi:hypothetical protein
MAAARELKRDDPSWLDDGLAQLEPPSVTCPSCGARNGAWRRVCSACAGVLPTPAGEERALQLASLEAFLQKSAVDRSAEPAKDPPPSASVRPSLRLKATNPTDPPPAEQRASPKAPEIPDKDPPPSAPVRSSLRLKATGPADPAPAEQRASPKAPEGPRQPAKDPSPSAPVRPSPRLKTTKPADPAPAEQRASPKAPEGPRQPAKAPSAPIWPWARLKTTAPADPAPAAQRASPNVPDRPPRLLKWPDAPSVKSAVLAPAARPDASAGPANLSLAPGTGSLETRRRSSGAAFRIGAVAAGALVLFVVGFALENHDRLGRTLSPGATAPGATRRQPQSHPPVTAPRPAPTPQIVVASSASSSPVVRPHGRAHAATHRRGHAIASHHVAGA